jgi:hypothetical protein
MVLANPTLKLTGTMSQVAELRKLRRRKGFWGNLKQRKGGGGARKQYERVGLVASKNVAIQVSEGLWQERLGTTWRLLRHTKTHWSCRTRSAQSRATTVKTYIPDVNC